MHVHTPLADGPGKPTGAAHFRQAQAGDRDALNELMAVHDGLVHAVVQRQALGNLSYAEALQAGRIGLWRAILGYDPQRGAAFSTYAWTCIQRRVWQAVKRANPFSQPPAGAMVSPPVRELDPAVVWEATTVRSALYDLVVRLPARLRYIIVTYYGLAETSPASYRQIARALGLNHERVRQLHTQALVWLRHPAHSYLLRSLKIINLGERFADGSVRLVRDIPVGTPTWKCLYHRARNATEGRNATLEG